jgi:hypothetical protein
MSERAIGYTLLTLGTMVMILASVQIILLMLGRTKPPTNFAFTEVYTSTANLVNETQTTQNGVTRRVADSQATPDAKSELNPDVANEAFNYALFFFALGFLLNTGHKMAEIGTRLLRPTTVQVTSRNMVDIARAAPSPNDIANQPSPVANLDVPAKPAF